MDKLYCNTRTERRNLAGGGKWRHQLKKYRTREGIILPPGKKRGVVKGTNTHHTARRKDVEMNEKVVILYLISGAITFVEEGSKKRS